jgi:hypothetical protein
MTQVGLSQREYELRQAHGLTGAFEERLQADRMASYAERIGSEVFNYHGKYHKERATRLAISLVDRESDVYRFLAAPVGTVAAVAAWGTGTPIEFVPVQGVRLLSETSVLQKTTRLAISSKLANTDLKVDLSDPAWSWYAATVSRGLPLAGLSARLSSIRALSSDLIWMGQGPVAEESLSLEYQVRF